jgi:hypothetical protein
MIAAAAGSLSSARAATVVFHAYTNPSASGSSGATSSTPTEAFGAISEGFAAVGSDTATQWNSILGSGATIGSATTLTRGNDVVTGNYVFWVNRNGLPVPDDHWNRSNYGTVGGGTIDRGDHATDNSRTYPTTIDISPATTAHSGADLLGNQSLIGVGTNRYLFIDPDGSLSRISVLTGAASVSELTWTSFAAGPFMGTTLVSQLQNFIGYDSGASVGDDVLVFLQGDTIVRYNIDGTVAEELNPTWTGIMEGKTLGDVIDGDYDDLTYLGWDNGPVIMQTVPEPASLTLVAAGAMLFLRRRRR